MTWGYDTTTSRDYQSCHCPSCYRQLCDVPGDAQYLGGERHEYNLKVLWLADKGTDPAYLRQRICKYLKFPVL